MLLLPSQYWAQMWYIANVLVMLYRSRVRGEERDGWWRVLQVIAKDSEIINHWNVCTNFPFNCITSCNCNKLCDCFGKYGNKPLILFTKCSHFHITMPCTASLGGHRANYERTIERAHWPKTGFLSKYH